MYTLRFPRDREEWTYQDKGRASVNSEPITYWIMLKTAFDEVIRQL